MPAPMPAVPRSSLPALPSQRGENERRSNTYVKRLMRDPIDHRRSTTDENLAHRIHKVLRAAGLIGDVRVDLGLDVEQDRFRGRAVDKVKHLFQGGDLGTGIDLCIGFSKYSQTIDGGLAPGGPDGKAAGRGRPVIYGGPCV